MLSPTKTNKNNNTKIKLPNNKTKKNNLQLEYLKLFYPDTVLQTIKNNQDITNIQNVSTIYSKPPKITIQNAKPKLYLITMTDPDAPNGIQKNMNQSKQINQSKNHTYTHWVYLQDMRQQNTTNTPSSTQILVPYAPPTPPYGIHRYQFKIYDITNLQQTILDTLKNKINNTTSLDRNTYCRNNLKNLIKYKLNTLFQYKINSKK
jgi:phosphatidylethanolamine-binding protein (PEBP) family uncharacterized protein